MMELSFNTKIKRSRAFKALPSNSIIPLSDTNKDYLHLTFQVNSLLEYLQVVKMINMAHYSNETLVFRGMSKSEWSPLPSLARYTGNDETIEYNMVSEFLTLRPEEFVGLRSNFEILAKMQHYGLPTRLLDFTTNPLVALYFACENNPKSDARVLCSSACLTDGQDHLVETICSSCKKYGLINLRIEDLLMDSDLTPYKYIARLYLQRDHRPLFVKPWYWNQRIINQRAIFLVFPNALFDHLGKITYYQEASEDEAIQTSVIAESEQFDKIYPEWHPRNHIETKLEKWTEKHKNQTNSNHSLVRRDFSVNCKTMHKLFSFYQKHEIIEHHTYQYTELGKTILGRRFLFNGDIQPVDEDSMKTMFCSIVIPAKAKKEIMLDLESVGIDKAFIYPELEYTAEKIKRKYF
mgnify:CR=1 FL=1